MKRTQFAAALLALTLLTGCAANAPSEPAATAPPAVTEPAGQTEAVDILLSDDGVVCDSDAVYSENGMIYYETGGEADTRTSGEAAAHTVVHITAPGVYRVSGTLAAGQLFVDLDEAAQSDPDARVTLLLDGAQLTCSAAPAILFYRVYECAPDAAFSRTPELTDAGAVVALADGSFNLVSGTVASRVSMRVEGDSGSLTVNAASEGLTAERHLELNGGNLTVAAQADGIHANADGHSVATVNGGLLSITGGCGEAGGGIVSDGALVVNGGTVFASANERSGAGLAADCGIFLNGGIVVATGSANGSAENASQQQFMELHFAQTVQQGSALCIQNGEAALLEDTVTRPFASLTFSAPELEAGVAYAVTVNGIVQQHGADLASAGTDLLPPTEGRGPGEFEIPEPPGGMDQPVISVEGSRNDAQPAQAGGALPVRPDGEAMGSQAFTLTETDHSFWNVRDAE